MTDVFNNCFQSIIENLYLFQWPDEPQLNIFDEIKIIVEKFWYQPSINKLKQQFSIKKRFLFKSPTKEFVKKSI